MSETPDDEPPSTDALAGDDEAALRAAAAEAEGQTPSQTAAQMDAQMDVSDAEPAQQTVEADSVQLLPSLRQVEAQRDEYLGSLQRAQADFANYRKRSMREGAAQREQGAAEVLARILDVVDDFELAVLAAQATKEAEGRTEHATQAAQGGGRPATSGSDVAGLRKGVEMVYGKLVDVLRSFGVEKIGQENVPFDPELHEAVQTVDDGQRRELPVVIEVLRPGYLVNGRVLRAAMVKVLK